jgi:hypothetical protein
MHGPINVKSPNNASKWQMGFNSASKGLKLERAHNIRSSGEDPSELMAVEERKWNRNKRRVES